jgi:hypothetical protein
MYALGEQYGTKFFSTSALRYASELNDYGAGVNSVSVKGGGRCFDEYIVHQLEMLVKLMGIGAEEVKVFPGGKQRMCVVKYADGRCGFLHYASSNAFHITVEDTEGNSDSRSIDSAYFLDMLESILKFFESGELPFAKEQTLEVMGIRDALLKAVKNPDQWIKIF